MNNINSIRNDIDDNILHFLFEHDNKFLATIISNLIKDTKIIDIKSAFIELCNYFQSIDKLGNLKIPNIKELQYFKRGCECVNFKEKKTDLNQKYIYKFYNIHYDLIHVLYRIIMLNFYFFKNYQAKFLGLYKNKYIIVQQPYIKSTAYLFNKTQLNQIKENFYLNRGFKIFNSSAVVNKKILIQDLSISNYTILSNNDIFIYDANVISLNTFLIKLQHCVK